MSVASQVRGRWPVGAADGAGGSRAALGFRTLNTAWGERAERGPHGASER